MDKNLQIRNSTTEFLIFTSQAGENSIEVKVEDETVWLTQKFIAKLFQKGRSTITEHLKHIFEDGELDEKEVCRNFRHTANDGKTYTTKYYNLDAIISVGYRVNSKKAVAKNYLSKDELESLGRVVSAYLDLAEERAKRNIPMTMEDWAKRLDMFLEFDDRQILQNAGKITAQIAKDHALSEYEKYRVIQDKLYKSDFDRLLEKL